MSTTTKIDARRGAGTLAERAGLCGIVGGSLWFASGVAGILVPSLNEPGTTVYMVGGTIATVSLVLLAFGFFGLLWGGALGGRVGKALFVLAVLGYVLMVVGGFQTVAGIGPLVDPEAGIALIYLLGRLIAAVFTVLTGVAVLVARRWPPWAALVPLLLGLCPLVGELGFLILFGQPSQLFNAAWGFFGVLLGLATLRQARPETRSADNNPPVVA